MYSQTKYGRRKEAKCRIEKFDVNFKADFLFQNDFKKIIPFPIEKLEFRSQALLNTIIVIAHLISNLESRNFPN